METKLRRLIIATFVGTFVLLVAMAVTWNMVLYKPLKEKTAKATTDYETEKKDADQLAKQVTLRKQAQDDRELYKTELEEMRARYRSLKFDISSPAAQKATWMRYVQEYTTDYGQKVERQLMEVAERSGCKPLTQADLGVKVQTLPQIPEDLTVPPSGFLKPLAPGDINLTIEGSYGDIIRFMDQINRPIPDPMDPQGMLNILFVVKNNVKLGGGSSPNIKATFTVTPYLIATGPSVTLPAAAPAAAAPAEGQPAPATGQPAA